MRKSLLLKKIISLNWRHENSLYKSAPWAKFVMIRFTLLTKTKTFSAFPMQFVYPLFPCQSASSLVAVEGAAHARLLHPRVGGDRRAGEHVARPRARLQRLPQGPGRGAHRRAQAPGSLPAGQYLHVLKHLAHFLQVSINLQIASVVGAPALCVGGWAVLGLTCHRAVHLNLYPSTRSDVKLLLHRQTRYANCCTCVCRMTCCLCKQENWIMGSAVSTIVRSVDEHQYRAAGLVMVYRHVALG